MRRPEGKERSALDNNDVLDLLDSMPPLSIVRARHTGKYPCSCADESWLIFPSDSARGGPHRKSLNGLFHSLRTRYSVNTLRSRSNGVADPKTPEGGFDIFNQRRPIAKSIKSQSNDASTSWRHSQDSTAATSVDQSYSAPVPRLEVLQELPKEPVLFHESLKQAIGAIEHRYGVSERMVSTTEPQTVDEKVLPQPKETASLARPKWHTLPPRSYFWPKVDSSPVPVPVTDSSKDAMEPSHTCVCFKRRDDLPAALPLDWLDKILTDSVTFRDWTIRLVKPELTVAIGQ